MPQMQICRGMQPVVSTTARLRDGHTANFVHKRGDHRMLAATIAPVSQLPCYHATGGGSGGDLDSHRVITCKAHNGRLCLLRQPQLLHPAAHDRPPHCTSFINMDRQCLHQFPSQLQLPASGWIAPKSLDVLWEQALVRHPQQCALNPSA